MPEDRATTVETAKGQTLTFTHLSGFDEVSRCFEFTVGLTGPELDVEPDALINRPLAIEAESSDPKRWFHGLVSEFRIVKVEERVASYEVVLRPWLWLLGLTYDCRIFQNLSVIEIVEKVFGKYPEAEFEKRLQKSYSPREYCVQFDESDLDFVQRLLEHEGIFYFFEYGESGHTLVLADSIAKLKPAEGYEVVPFHIEDNPARRDRDFLSRWLVTSGLRPAAYVHTDYNFEKPSLSLLTQSEATPVPKLFRGEIYRQPGAHQDVSLGDAVAAIRREELQAPHVRVLAGGTARGLASGCTFKLDGHPRESQNAEHLVLRADYRLVDPEHRAGLEAAGESYLVELVAAPTALPYRPPRTTPHPVMRGPQTATVVGPGGAEIYTDKHARVKVQFHWDRLGKKDENSSCFVRVSAAWAGAGWGFIQIPRIGQEVIVDFIEGDPDRPIITGRVYNATEVPPYGLPGSATQSGWKSNSSPGGGGYNELMFEDKAGSELVNFQAQKDNKLLVKNDRTKLVQHDQSDRIDNNAKHSVGVNLDEDVGKNKTTKVGVDRTVEDRLERHRDGRRQPVADGGVERDDQDRLELDRDDRGEPHPDRGAGADGDGRRGAGRHGRAPPRRGRWAAVQANTIGASRSVTVGAGQSHSIGAADSWTVGARPDGADQRPTKASRSAAGRARRSARPAPPRSASDDATEVGGQHALKIGKGSLDPDRRGQRLSTSART